VARRERRGLGATGVPVIGDAEKQDERNRPRYGKQAPHMSSPSVKSGCGEATFDGDQDILY
jgi:hypothetical protein